MSQPTINNIWFHNQIIKILYEITWLLSLALPLIYSFIVGKSESLTSKINLVLSITQVVFPPNSTASIPFPSNLSFSWYLKNLYFFIYVYIYIFLYMFFIYVLYIFYICLYIFIYVYIYIFLYMFISIPIFKFLLGSSYKIMFGVEIAMCIKT